MIYLLKNKFDCGGQYTKVIDRRVRELGVKSDIFPINVKSEDLLDYQAVILSGGPNNIGESQRLNFDEKIFENAEIKLLLSAMNIIPGKYNSSKLRYGRLAICTDADSDGYHIGLLIMSALHYLAPQFIQEGRLYWLRSPLYIVENRGKETYYFTDEEFNQVRKTIKGTVTRAKGLGELSPETAHNSMFISQNQRMEQLQYSKEAVNWLEMYASDEVKKFLADERAKIEKTIKETH